MQDCDSLVKFVLWSFYYLKCIFICLCRLFYFAPRLDHLLSLTPVLLHAPLYYFFIFPPIGLNLQSSCFFLTLLSLLLFFLLSWASKHPCCLLMYLFDPFLIEYLPWYLFFQVYAIEWNHSPATLGTIWPIFHLTCRALWSTWDFHDLSRFQMVLSYSVNIVSTLLKLQQLPITLCCRFYNSFPLVTLF